MLNQKMTILSAILVVSGLAACDKGEPETLEGPVAVVETTEEAPAEVAEAPSEAKSSYDEWEIDKVATAVESKSAVPVDANSDETRKGEGVVPGAVLLTSSSRYEVSELPEDKSSELVFYCGSTSCTASDTAAERALENGYTNVHVMRAGIKGWKEAGKPTEMPNS